ncbi:ABC transporter ATP-binding protein [Leucobacter denitrificans]|uniref:ATP-binding cassette domain-containing protein n=1 Tax=Leucobacter denitrificans TaxID=683042 RepID=A0A7G9S6Z6_9MICO|nr:ATP-binding cassette domain-containing protein [Leucobacter denitrificans]QNN63621.1 ATP-binding cassette domain-containing protein [Leucobacter denitrificans]
MTEILRLEHVDFIRSHRHILSDINFTVNAGEHWALIGPNGAGKSTIMSMCGAVNHPSGGYVYVLGHRLGRVDIRFLRQKIGHVNPRHPLRSALTGRQVMLTGLTGTTELMVRWESDVDAESRADELVGLLGMHDLQHRNWETMSQGERGRTLIARALMSDPPLLLLDEPSTGLDVAAREEFLATVDELHELQPELATVLVTHHLEELPETTTHAMLIRDGRVHASGAATEVLTTELVSECFSYPIKIDHQDGRWQARAMRVRSKVTA